MFFLTRLATRPAPVLRASRLLPVVVEHRSLLHTTRARAALSESDLGREGQDAEIEHHKQDQLRKQKEGKGEWKGELASNSEATVKADRGDMNASKENIEKMQQQTAEVAKKDHEGK